MTLIFRYLLLMFFMCLAPLLSRSDEYYDYEYYHIQPGFRELATARDAYKDHMLKTVNYVTNLQTPGYIRKSTKNIRKYNERLDQYEIDVKVSMKWIEGITFETGRPLDFAINGMNRGFFTIRIYDQLAYTRDGRFRIDLDNRVVTIAGNFPVIEEGGGYIYVSDPGGDFSISRSGALYNNNEYVGRFKITVFEKISDMDRALKAMGNTIFVLTDDIKTEEGYSGYSILQGFVQRSNTFKSNDSALYKNYFNAANQSMMMMFDAEKKQYSIIQP